MRLLLALIASLPLMAQPTVSNVTADGIGTSTARIRWDISPAAGTHRIRWGTTTSYEGGAIGGIQGINSGGNMSSFSAGLSGLPSGTTVHACPQSSSDGGSTWSTCVDVSFSTLARGSTFPAYPASPVAWSAAYPDTAGYTTRAVASDCSDLQTHINAAVANQATAGSLVTIPAGTTCSGSYTTPTDPAVKSFGTTDVNTTTDRITVTSHGWSNGQQIRFARGGCLPTSDPGAGGSCQLRGTIVQGRVYYVVGSATNDFQVAETSGGSAIDLTDTGSGTNYVFAWPPTHSNEVIIRTATTDGEFAPAGVRLNPTVWSSKLAKLQIAGGTWNNSLLAFKPGIGAHHIRLMGLEITHSDASANLSGSTDPRPTYGLVEFAPENALGYLTFDRIWMHGLGYPNRLYRPIVSWDGAYISSIDSYYDDWDFWRPQKSGLTPTLDTQTVTIAAGATTLRANQACTAASPITFTRTGGTTSVDSRIYVAIDCTPTLVVPTGTTATCTGSMTDYLAASHDCSVTTDASPAFPVDAYGGHASLPLATVSASAGTWSAASDPYGYAPSNYITEGTNGMIAGWGPGPYLMQNNYSEGVGNLWHFDESSAAVGPSGSGYTIRRNTFVMDEAKRSTAAGSNGLRYMNRNGIEWKNGNTILIEGNTWDGFWADVSSTGCVILHTPQGGKYSQITDSEIRYNTMTDSACFLSAIGGISYANDWEGSTKPFERLYVHDNIIDSTNGWVQVEAPRTTSASFPFYIGYAIGDVRIQNNTVFDVRGPTPRFWHQIQNPISGVYAINNILWINNDDGTYGMGNEFPGNTADPNCTAVAKAGMDCAWISGVTTEYTFSNNLLVPYYANSEAPSGLVDLTTTATNYSGLSPYIITGGDIATRLSNVGFYDAAGGGFRLKANSAFQSGGASPGLYGRALGADVDALEVAQGKVYNVRVLSITSSGATVYFTAPDATGCAVDYGTASDLATFTRAANAGGSRLQSVSLSGLSTGTQYYYRVNCAVEQPTGSFTTQ